MRRKAVAPRGSSRLTPTARSPCPRPPRAGGPAARTAIMAGTSASWPMAATSAEPADGDETDGRRMRTRPPRSDAVAITVTTTETTATETSTCSDETTDETTDATEATTPPFAKRRLSPLSPLATRHGGCARSRRGPRQDGRRRQELQPRRAVSEAAHAANAARAHARAEAKVARSAAREARAAERAANQPDQDPRQGPQGLTQSPPSIRSGAAMRRRF